MIKKVYILSIKVVNMKSNAITIWSIEPCYTRVSNGKNRINTKIHKHTLPSVSVGDYHVELSQILGRGSYGIIYRAHHKSTSKHVW